MTDSIRDFPQRKPTITAIVANGIRAGQPLKAIFAMARNIHPDKPVDAAKAEIAGAIEAGVEGQIGAEILGDVGAAVARELERVKAEATRPTVPVYRVVRRIVNQTLDAVGARRSNATPTLQSWVKEAADVIKRHPAHLDIVSWLAVQGLESMLSSAAGERALDYAVDFGSPEVEAIEADLRYEPPED